MYVETKLETAKPDRTPWNRGKLVGPKPPLKLTEIWAIRIRLQLAERVRDLALFNLAIDSKLRGCDLLQLRVCDVAHGGRVLSRATVLQRKTGHAVKVEVTEQNKEVLQFANDPTMAVKYAIMKDATGEKAKLKVANQILNNMGLVQSHCALLNGEKEMAKMNNIIQLSDSIATIEEMDQKAKEKKVQSAEDKLKDLAPEALKKYQARNKDFKNLKKKEICAIAFLYYI